MEAPMTSMPANLPEIGHEGRVVYGGAEKISAAERFVGLARYLKIAAYVIGLRASQWLQRRRWKETAATPHLAALQRDGVVPLRLPDGAKSSILAAARPYFDRLAERRAGIARGRHTYADGQLDTTEPDTPELFAAIEQGLSAAGVTASVRAYLGCRAELRRVTMQINDESDTYWRAHFDKAHAPIPPTAFMHVDNTYGVVKAILYISEVGPDNGPFSYVPGTHRNRMGFLEALFLRVTDIWIDVWPENRRLLFMLPRKLRKKAKFGDDIPSDSSLARWLLAHERFLTSSECDLMLFDVNGVHRGGLVTRGERRVIQIMMR